jgi:hypothetical protein
VKTKPKPKPRAKTRSKDSLPNQAVLDELAFLRTTFREVVGHYTGEVEAEIAQIVGLIKAEAEAKKLPHDRVHDLRDMLMLLRGLEVKPAKGRRRDLKKMENAIEELRRIAERW